MQHRRLHSLAVLFWMALALRAFVETAPELPVQDALSLAGGPAGIAILESEEEAFEEPLSLAAGAASPALPSGGEARLAGLARSPLLTFDILLLTQRQNE